MTSNENKLKEFKRFGIKDLEIQKGMDLDEVDSDEYTVITYKSLMSGEMTIVEDTSLHVEGANIGVNVRWLMDNINDYHGKKATWIVLLGVNDGEYIKIYEGKVEGKLVKTDVKNDTTFGFDSNFIPNGQTKTLSELDSLGLKDNFSARKKAVESLLSNDVSYVKHIKNIPQWSGSYQSNEKESTPKTKKMV